MKKKKENVSAIIIFQMILLILPLFAENRYYNIVEAKAHMLTLISAAAWILIVISGLKTGEKCLARQKFNSLDAAMIGAAVVALVSCACSGNFGGTFMGRSGWGIGGFLLMSFSAMYLFLSKNADFAYRRWVPGLTVACLIALLSAAHSAGNDVLAFHSGIEPTEYFTFKSTLGNLNAHVGYVCLLLPLVFVAFLNEKERGRAVGQFIFLLALLAETVFACSDGVYLGLGLCAFIAIPHVCGNSQRMRRAGLALAAFGLMELACGQLGCFARNNETVNGIAAFMRLPQTAGAMTLAGIALYALLKWQPRMLDNRKTSAVCTAVLEILLLSAAVYYIRDAVLNFSDAWGTGRGVIWRASLEYYAGLSPWKKLIGIGPELQQFVFPPWLSTTFTCHSEPVQILLTMGIAGIAVWLAVYASVICRVINDRTWKSERVMYALPIVAYLGQSLVNSTMATNLGIFCILLASFRKMCYNNV